MKNLVVITMLVLSSSLFLTSCEKEYDVNPLTPGNTQQNVHKDGAIVVDPNSGTSGETGGGTGITDSGRDEDYDKSGKVKGRKS